MSPLITPILLISLTVGIQAQPVSSDSDVGLQTYLMAVIEAQERHFNARIDALEESVKQSLAAAEKAILKAETATEKRLEGLNELRALTEDRSLQFMPRDVTEALTQRLSERINGLQERSTEQMNDLKSRLDRIDGTKSGLSAGWGYLVGVIGLISAIIAIMVALRTEKPSTIQPVEYRSITPPPNP